MPFFSQDIDSESSISNFFFSLSETKVYKVIATITEDLWADAVGQIFLVTATPIFLGTSWFAGYLSRFTGGNGGLMLSRMGFQLMDLLSLIPNIIISSIYTIVRQFTNLFLLSTIAIFYSLTAIAIGVFLGIYVGRQVALLPAVLQIFIGVFGYFLFLGGLFSFISNLLWYISSSEGRVRALILLIITFIGVSFSSPFIREASTISIDQPFFILSEVITASIVFFVLIFPFVIGRNSAELSIKFNMLPRIRNIEIKQPILLLENRLKKQFIPEIKSGASWLNSKFLPISIQPDIYQYQFPESSLAYLVATFPDSHAIFVMHDNAQKQIDQGRLIITSREHVTSLEFYPPSKLEDKDFVTVMFSVGRWIKQRLPNKKKSRKP
ncbi:MAG: hypothetical protein MUD01_10865 [Chloroflexaceae bacterium]|jgi:hypothetical protein|nr:hypothetical protein [Chloroflexaceae bacterium]